MTNVLKKRGGLLWRGSRARSEVNRRNPAIRGGKSADWLLRAGLAARRCRLELGRRGTGVGKLRSLFLELHLSGRESFRPWFPCPRPLLGPRVTERPPSAAERPHPRRSLEPIPGAWAHAAGECADACARGSGLADRFHIARLVSFAADGAFFMVEFFVRAPIEPGHVRPKIARGAVGQRQGIEAEMEFAASLYLSRPFYIRDGAHNVTTGGNYDPAARQDRKYRFEVHAVSRNRILGADAIDKAEGNVVPTSTIYSFDSAWSVNAAAKKTKVHRVARVMQ